MIRKWLNAIRDWLGKMSRRRYIKKNFKEEIPVRKLFIFYEENDKDAMEQAVDLSQLEEDGIAILQVKVDPNAYSKKALDELENTYLEINDTKLLVLEDEEGIFITWEGILY